ncbi:putative NT-type C2 domain-containing protein [Helianthus annuus]|nr:putative NT-type C2 domain-containing protein [Helianthus annuus]
MLRNTKWKLEKTKVKVVFRLQFHATNIPQSGWDKLFICFIPTESGKIIAKTSKANVRNGTCKWADPIYETTRLLVDSRNKRYDDKLYNLIVGMGSSHASILGEATINLADYADALNPYAISLPLHGSDQGTILHVTVQLLTAKTGFREFEQQFDKGLQSSSNYGREVEPSITTAPSSSELHISRELVPIMEETDMHEEFSDATPVVEYNGQCNNSESYNAAKNDSSGIPESRALNGPVRSQTRSTENADYSKDNKLAIALEENHRLRGSLETAESFIFELKQEVNTLHHQANEMNMETQKIAQHLTNEISSGLKLEREVMILKSECSKFKDELKQLNEIKLRSQFMEKTQDQRVNGLFLVEGRIRELQKKILIGFHESDLSFINSDLEMLLGIVQNLEKGTGLTRVVDLGESQSLELLCQLNEAKAERGNLIKKMNEMECYYESLVQELEENRDRLLVEFQKLRYEHLSCINTISTCKSETETIRLCMKDQILKFDKERLALSCVNEELEKRVMVVEAYVQELEENRERIVKEFESLKNEHSTCDDTISSCKYDTELIRHELKHQTLKLTKEKQELEYVKRELEKRVLTAESLVQEVQKNREQVLGEFRCLKNEHSTCADTILSLKAEIESIRRDMEDQALKFAKEKHDFGCVNEQLDKRVTTAEALVQELEKNREEILGELKSLQYEHSTCGDTILTHNNMNNRILRLEKERHDLGCVNEELKKRVVTTEALVQELEEKQERILGEFQSLQTEHSTCGNTILAHKSMNDQILRLEKERNDLCCVNKELKKRVVTTEALIQELEGKQEHILGEFQSLQIEHSTCGDTISAHKNMNDQILRLEKERNDLVCVNEELKKRVMTSEALIQELEEKQEHISGEFQSLNNEHITYKSETESIHHVNKELEKRVLELEENQEKILEDFEILKTEHSTCGDTLTACKTETESIRVDMNSQILKLIEEKHALDSINKELEKRVTTLESALERGRVNYAIAVTQLQKNLDMLAAQVSSLFETNQNLIKQTLSSENCASIAHDRREKPLSGGDDLSDEQIYEICCERLYFDVYSVILEERLFEVSRDARKIKTDHEKNVPEHQSESLRIAFMKEQCETTVQELKQQLFVSKRHGDDILIKLQDALDEIESRKKCEASYLKRIDELSFKIGGLEGELQSIQAELDCALLNLECCREEKEKIIAQITEFEKMKNERSILAMMSCGSSFQDLQRELMQLHKANEELECMYPRFKNFTGDGNALGRVLALEIELAGALMVKKKSTIQFQSSFLKQHSDEEAIFRSFRDINELIKDTLEIKSKYVNVETELNEMHERYTQLSLQLAEVEGERQKLMMSVKYAR